MQTRVGTVHTTRATHGAALLVVTTYALTLPVGHRFPMAKYALLREGAVAGGLVGFPPLHEPDRAAHEDLHRVHTPEYVERR